MAHTTPYTNTIQQAIPADYDAITAVWEASVRATHHFLKEEDIAFIKPLVRHQFLQAVHLFCTKDNKGNVTGFLGVLNGKIEMLFIHPAQQSKGLGKALLHYAIQQLGCTTVDVNEQNEPAVGFYKHFGFCVTGRSEKDGLGMPYPLLHLQLC